MISYAIVPYVGVCLIFQKEIPNSTNSNSLAKQDVTVTAQRMSVLIDLLFEMQKDLQAMTSPDLYVAGQGALALRKHGLLYLARLNLNEQGQQNHYYYMSKLLDVVTQHVFDELKLFRTDLPLLYHRRMYLITWFHYSITSTV